MKKMHKAFFVVLMCVIFPLTACLPAANAQAAATPTSAPAATIPLNAVLVLTPEFCASLYKRGNAWTTGRETFKVGEMACKELEAVLKPVFDNLTVVKEPPSGGAAQVILIPKFANVEATASAMAFSNRQMDVLIEWTVENAAGKTIWLQTVKGSSKPHMSGNMFTAGHQEHVILRESVDDAAKQSATAMAAAPEILKLVPNKESGTKQGTTPQ